jgi:hypothetical protein
MGDWDRMQPGKGTLRPYISQEIPPVKVKHNLHWFQWFTYLLVCFTCIAVLISIIDTYLFINHVQAALQHLSDEWSK